MTDQADVEDPLRPRSSYPESINDYVSRLPRRRWSHTARGLLLALPGSGIVVVPYEQRPGGYWACVVVGLDRASHPGLLNHVARRRPEISRSVKHSNRSSEKSWTEP
jgi:hypothetical protein